MKVAIITSGFLPVIDGVTVSGYHRLQKLSELGHTVKLFCPDYRSLAKLYPNWQEFSGNILPGVTVINLPSLPFFVDFETNVSFWGYGRLLAELREFQPDLIHVDEPERLFIGFLRRPGLAYTRRAGIPCVCFFRTNFLEYLEHFFPLPPILISGLRSLLKRLIIWVYNSYDATLVASTITHQKLLELGLNNTRYDKLLGFDAAQFSPGLRREDFFTKQYQLPCDRQVKLIFLGRLTPDKGWEFTLEAFEQLSPDILAKIAIVVAGDGQMKEEIAARLGQLTPHVYVLGRVQPQDVPALMANCDLHVTASEMETRGLTVLEALASGLPVLAPRAGGVIQNIEEGENGFLFAPGDRQDFLAKLTKLIENPKLRQQMGEKGRESMKQYSWDETVRNLVAIWKEWIAKKCL